MVKLNKLSENTFWYELKDCEIIKEQRESSKNIEKLKASKDKQKNTLIIVKINLILNLKIDSIKIKQLGNNRVKICKTQ